MGASCCCCRDAIATVPPATGNHRHHRPSAGYATLPPNTPPRVVNACDICGLQMDPCLLDGHRESCRARHRRAMKEQQERSALHTRQVADAAVPVNTEAPPSSSTSGQSQPPQEMLCVICLEGLKEYAFIPCGHLVGCANCVRTLDRCPMCRTTRTGLLHLDPKQERELCLCKHCGHIITPAFFDGHREVCSLRMRQLREQQHLDDTPMIADAAASIDPTAEGEPNKAEHTLCLHCKVRMRNTALVPCAHRVLCSECAAAISYCPICCERVTSTVVTFDC